MTQGSDPVGKVDTANREMMVRVQPADGKQSQNQGESRNGEREDEVNAHRYNVEDSRQKQFDHLFLALALLVYLAAHLIGLSDYPIFFFTDEAVQTVLAADLVRDGLLGYDKVFLPTYFLNVYQYNLGVSVYVQVLPYLLFGKSILATRGTAAITTVLAALSLALSITKIFKGRFGWTAVLILSLTPAWFLHSRTAFETSLGTSFYAAFLYSYLRYRTDKPPYLYAAMGLSWLAFYTYTPLRLIVGLTWIGLVFSDLGYHRRQRKVVLAGLGLGLLLALPWLRFEMQHPDENLRHLKILGSYWIQPLAWPDKLIIYIREYIQGVNPAYWYLPNNLDIPRHKMGDFSHVMLASLPLAATGLVVCIKNFRNSAYRLILISLAAAPAGAALVALGITRILVMVIPITLLTSIGLERFFSWVRNRAESSKRKLAGPKLDPFFSAGLFLILGFGNVALLGDALTNGSLWSQDYGLSGMQYGAKQIFQAAVDYQSKNPEAELIVSPAWANGADIIARFFLPDNTDIQLGSILGFMIEKRPMNGNTVFVMIPEEYERVLESNKFQNVQVEQTLPYPNGKPGFYFVKLQYVKDIDNILERERAERVALREEMILVGNQPVTIRFTGLDMGKIEQIFDGDPETLIRTAGANPLVIEMSFGQPVSIQGLMLRIGGTATRIQASVRIPTENNRTAWTMAFDNVPNPRQVEIVFDRMYETDWLGLEITNSNDGELGHVHLWEIAFQ